MDDAGRAPVVREPPQEPAVQARARHHARPLPSRWGKGCDSGEESEPGEEAGGLQHAVPLPTQGDRAATGTDLPRGVGAGGVPQRAQLAHGVAALRGVHAARPVDPVRAHARQVPAVPLQSRAQLHGRV